MLATRVIPCLLLRNQGLVKTVKFKDPTYVGDPINAIRIFNGKEVDELLFLDITATSERRRPPFRMIAEIASECFMPVCYGGGVTTVEDLRELFAIGIEKVAINSAAVADPALIRRCADDFGSQSVVVAMDVRKSLFGKYEVYTESGRKSTGLDPLAHARRMQELGAGELLLTAIDRDGTMNGYDTALVKRVSAEVDIPVIACGGAGSLRDLGLAVENGASAVAAGSMFVFYGKHRAVLINYPEAKELQGLFGKQT